MLQKQKQNFNQSKLKSFLSSVLETVEQENQSFGSDANLSDLESEPYFGIMFNCSDFKSVKYLYHLFISTTRPEPPDRLWVTILAITGPIGLALVVTILIAGKFLLRRR